MKKMVCVLVLACVIVGAVFAQAKPAAAPVEKSRKNSIGMDLVPLVRGFINWDERDNLYTYTEFRVSFSYERSVVPHFSIGGNFDTWFSKMDVEYGKDHDSFYVAISGEGRYYPTANFDKFFVGTALGFNVYSVDGKSKEDDGGFAGLLFAVKTGYKVITSSGFYMEPSLSYVLSESTRTGDGPSGWNVGMRLGFSF